MSRIRSTSPHRPFLALLPVENREIFAFASLYDVWRDPATNKELSSYTLITTEPNELVGQFHGRMPVILRWEDEDAWVNPDIVEPEQLQQLLQPYSADLMEEWAVGDEARNPSNDSPELIQPKSNEEPKPEQGRLI